MIVVIRNRITTLNNRFEGWANLIKVIELFKGKTFGHLKEHDGGLGFT